MRSRHFWIALSLALGSTASTGVAAVTQLSSLNDPTLATLISFGSTPVAVGPYEFSNFCFLGSSPGGSRTAAQIQLQAITTNG